MKSRLFVIPILFFLVLFFGGCRFLGISPDSPSENINDESIFTYESLVNHLKEEGATVEPLDEISQPFFSPMGKAIQLNEAEVQIFEFEGANESREAADSIAPDGSSAGTNMVTWLATPHFYKTDNLIALYIGDDPAVMKLLETFFGPQFAGR